MTNKPPKKRPIKTAKGITKKSKPAEETLEQSERKYKALIDTTGTGYVILDGNGKVLDANPEYVRLTGHKSLDEIAGRSVVEWTALHHRGKNIIEVKKCIEKGFVRNLEIDYIDKTGHITPIEINATLLEGTDGHYILTIVRDITERKKAEDDLQKSEERFRALIEHSHDAITLLTADGTVLYDSPSIVHVLGYSPTERIGQSVFEFVHLEERRNMAHSFAEFVQRPGAVDPSEVRFLHKDGTLRRIEGIRTNLLHESTVRAVVVNYRDITERKRAEEALQESESRLRKLSDNLPNGIVYQIDSGEDGQRRRFTYISAGVEQLHGITVTEALNNAMSIYGQVIAEDRLRIAEEEAFALANMVPLITEARLRLPSGEIRSRLFTSAPRRLPNNHLVWDGIEIDITERKLAEDLLRTSEDKYRLLFENASDAIFVAQDEMIIFPNPQLSLLTGYSSEELTCKSFKHFIHSEDSEMVVKMHRNRLQGHNVPSTYSFRAITKKGEILWVEVNMVSITWEKRPATLTFLRDITERKKAEEILKEKDRELEIKAKNLEEANIALKVLLRRTDEDRAELEEKVSLNVRDLVIPYVEKLKISSMDEIQRTFVNILESNLLQIISPFSHRMSSRFLNFTLTEIQVADLLRKGKTSKEIAELLNSSPRSITFHRENIRKKLGLKNKKANLKSYLLSLK
jgi:PAS domain S-box-containing protein